MWRLCSGIQYLVDQGGQLLADLVPLLNQVQTEPQSAMLWRDLAALHRRLVALAVEVLNPQLSTLWQSDLEYGRDNNETEQ